MRTSRPMTAQVTQMATQPDGQTPSGSHHGRGEPQCTREVIVHRSWTGGLSAPMSMLQKSAILWGCPLWRISHTEWRSEHEVVLSTLLRKDLSCFCFVDNSREPACKLPGSSVSTYHLTQGVLDTDMCQMQMYLSPRPSVRSPPPQVLRLKLP